MQCNAMRLYLVLSDFIVRVLAVEDFKHSFVRFKKKSFDIENGKKSILEISNLSVDAAEIFHN